jgi:hypothetical protein
VTFTVTVYRDRDHDRDHDHVRDRDRDHVRDRDCDRDQLGPASWQIFGSLLKRKSGDWEKFTERKSMVKAMMYEQKI